MVGVGATVSKTYRRTVIKFFTLEGWKPVTFHRRMLATYGDTCESKPTVTRLVKMFSNGQQKTRDLPWSGQAHKVVTEKLIMHIDSAQSREIDIKTLVILQMSSTFPSVLF
ncbi:hypothetical protein TNCV_1250191 [Trichonephila clavipes]|nr:hypothetical protein TNCV_1250191 [Trichonephila clavipes]